MKQFETLDETPLDVEDDRNSPQKENNTKYVELKGRYQGGIDPATKLRSGTGTYTYTNPFLQYQGEWLNGKKHGHGVLIMRDGSSFVGQFKDGEINGKGKKVTEDGTTYDGEWLQGEKHGFGEIQYGRRNVKELYYKGNWSLGVRHGQGELGLRNGNVITGNFIDNWPTGECEIKFADGGSYKGNLNKGVL